METNVIRVKNACITRLDDVKKYRFGYDGYRVEMTPVEAYRFYVAIDRALSTYSSDFLSLNIRVVTENVDRYFCISREQLFQMFVNMRADEKMGKALWCNE